MQPSEALVQSMGSPCLGCSEDQSTTSRYSGGLSASKRSRHGAEAPTSLPCQKRSGLIAVIPMARPPPGAMSAGAGLAGSGFLGVDDALWSLPPQAPKATAAASRAAGVPPGP